MVIGGRQEGLADVWVALQIWFASRLLPSRNRVLRRTFGARPGSWVGDVPYERASSSRRRSAVAGDRKMSYAGQKIFTAHDPHLVDLDRMDWGR